MAGDQIETPLDRLRQLLHDRLDEAVWHPFRPLKVFRLYEGTWVLAARHAGQVHLDGFASYPEAFDEAERLAQLIRDAYPLPRA